ncbi:MAG: M56 family metallopeptidase [Lachnospiraceae bacterium]|nr:M56 family metallopeptidase [Lachnospiraceae bacterium]
MEYLLVMSLSGTTSAYICILLRYLMKGRISAEIQYLLLKISVLYYLIPLPFLRKWYRDILVDFIGFRLIEDGDINILGRMSYRIAYVDGSVYINNYMKIQMAVVTVWMLAAIFILLISYYHYMKTRKFVISCINKINMEQEVIKVARRIGLCGLTQKVTVYYTLHNRENMTFGLFRPVILCGEAAKSPEAEMVLSHEIAHIKRFDVFWKILLRLTVILHWWNPAIWFVCRNFEWACECSCDDIALHGKTKEEIKAYMRLLIIESSRNGGEEAGRIRWGMGFKGEMIRLSERMENAMKMNRKKCSKAAVLITAVLVTVVNSITVFAYPEVNTVSGEWESVEEAERFINNPGMFITENAGEEERKKDIAYEYVNMEIRYEKQFIDEYGNIYQVKDDMGVSVYGSCSHQYVSGTYAEHNKNSDGSCTITQYSAQRCSKCGNVEKGNELVVLKFNTCPH